MDTNSEILNESINSINPLAIQSVNDFLLGEDAINIDNTSSPSIGGSKLPVVKSDNINIDYKEQEDLVVIDPTTNKPKLLVGLGDNKEALSIAKYTQLMTEEYREAGRFSTGDCMDRIEKRIAMFSNVPTPVSTTALSISNGIQTVFDSLQSISREKSKAQDADVNHNERYYGSVQSVSSDIKKKVMNLCKTMISEGVELDLVQDYIVDRPEYADILSRSGIVQTLIDEVVESAVNTIRSNTILKTKREAEEDTFLKNDVIAIKNSSKSFGTLFDLVTDSSLTAEDREREFENFLNNLHDVRYIVGSDKFYCTHCDDLVPGKDWYTILSPVNATFSIDAEATANVVPNPQQCPKCNRFYTLPNYVLVNIRDYVVTRSLSIVGAAQTGVTTAFTLTSKTLSILAGPLYIANDMLFSSMMEKEYGASAQLIEGVLEIDKSKYSDMIEEYVKFYKTTKLKKGEAKTVFGIINDGFDKELNSIDEDITKRVDSIEDLLVSKDIKLVDSLGISTKNVTSRADLNSRITKFIESTNKSMKKIPYNAPDLIERSKELATKINTAMSLLPENSILRTLMVNEISILRRLGVSFDKINTTSDLIVSLSSIRENLESMERIESIDKDITFINSLIKRFDAPRENGKVKVIFKSLKDSRLDIRLNCKSIVSVCGGDYSILKICAINSLVRELRDGMLNDLFTVNSSDIAQEEFIGNLSEAYSSSKDKMYFEEKLQEFYNDKTLSTSKPSVNTIISELKSFINRDYMYEFILPYSFIKIDLSLTDKPIETTDIDWIDIVTDLMIVTHYSGKFDKIIGIKEIMSVPSYVDDAHKVLVEEGLAKGKIEIQALPSAVPDSLAKTMAMFFELNSSGSTIRAWNDIISKDNCIRFEDADILYKSIKSRQYGEFLISGGFNEASKRLDSLVFIDRDKLHDPVRLEFLTEKMNKSIANRRKLLVSEFNKIRTRIIEAVFGKFGSEAIKKELSVMMGQLKVPFEYTPADEKVKMQIADSDLLILPHPSLHYSDMLGLINQVRDNGFSNVRIPLHLEGKVKVEDMVRIESLEELQEIESYLSGLYKMYIQAIQALQKIYKELVQAKSPNVMEQVRVKAIEFLKICEDRKIKYKLDKIYYLNVKEIFYTFPESEDYFTIKGLATMYTAMSDTDLKPMLLDRVVRYSSAGLSLPTSVISAEHQIQIDDTSADIEVTPNDYINYLLSAPFTGSIMIDYIIDRKNGVVTDLLVPITQDGRVMRDPVTDDYPFDESDLDVYTKAINITPQTSIEEVTNLIIESIDFESVYSARPNKYKALTLEDFTSAYEAVSQGVSKDTLNKYKYYMEELSTSDLEDKKTIALFVRYRAKVNKLVDINPDDINIEEIVSNFDNIINGIG